MSIIEAIPTICWRTRYAAAYIDGDKMVIRYRFPYSRQREAALLGAYCLTPANRTPYYQTLSSMVERSLLFMEYLHQEGIPSILNFENTYQKQEENGIIGIYGVLAAPVRPITQAIFQSDFNALTALDVFLRLAHILRDIRKTPTSPVLRYLDMDDVYLTNDNKILLGGFYYVAAETLDAPPAFLPDAPVVVPPSAPTARRDPTDDIKTLSRIAWNIFSGLPWDCCHTPASLRIPPKYAPPQLLRVLEFGLSGDPASCNTFHKQLMQCRKELAKTEFAQLTIPACKPLEKEYQFRTDREASAAATAGFSTLPQPM